MSKPRLARVAACTHHTSAAAAIVGSQLPWAAAAVREVVGVIDEVKKKWRGQGFRPGRVSHHSLNQQRKSASQDDSDRRTNRRSRSEIGTTQIETPRRLSPPHRMTSKQKYPRPKKKKKKMASKQVLIAAPQGSHITVPTCLPQQMPLPVQFAHAR